jgi:large subunit ribosomal protein L28
LFDGIASNDLQYLEKDNYMAKCEHCGKTTTFGHNRSFSKKATARTYLPNLQKVTVMENGRKVKKLLCAKCIRTLGKSK